MEFGIKITGLESFQKGMQAVADVMRVPAEMDRAAGEIKGKMIEESPRATSALQRSIAIETINSMKKIIAPELPYGYYQETRDHLAQGFPPIANIQRWAMAKGLEDGAGAAFLIARKISRQGYPANPFVERTFEWSRQQMDRWFGAWADHIQIAYQSG